jgi:hypothetical protein
MVREVDMAPPQGAWELALPLKKPLRGFEEVGTFEPPRRFQNAF